MTINSIKSREWSRWERLMLLFCYSHVQTATIAAYLNRTISSVYQMARKMNLSKDESVNRNAAWANGQKTGRLYGFQKGQAPWNKGKPHKPKGSERGWFKPGDMPRTWRPVGSVHRKRDGTWMRKVSDTRVKTVDWRPVHWLVWEEHNGPVPEGHIVIFKNHDHDDIRIENLECITRAENMWRNQYQRYPEPIAAAIQLRGALNRQINKRSRP